MIRSTIATDRTLDEARPVFALAVPAAREGAVMARVDGAAISELFRDIEMSERAVIAVFDSESRRLYRRQTSTEPIDLTVSGAPMAFSLPGWPACAAKAATRQPPARRHSSLSI